MKKETLIAVIFGIFLGGIVAAFIVFKSKDIELSRNKIISPNETVKEKPENATNMSFQALTVDDPADGLVVEKNSVTLKGKVEKDSLIVIQSPIKDMIFKADKNTFSVEFPLALGENAIKIVATPKNTTIRSQEKDLKIYFLDSEL